MTNCAYHPGRDAVGACVSCGKLICEECKKTIGGKIYCNPCSMSVVENTSGQGRLVTIPEEVRGWNWGAFFLCWIWGIGNRVWIALLALLPIVGFIMNIVLGIKGNEWAWRNKKWDSVVHFKTTQRIWAIVGLVVLVPYFFIIFAAIIIPNVGRMDRGKMEAAQTELDNVQTAVVIMMVDNGLDRLPNPVTIATNDMETFPDSSICEINKIIDPSGNAYSSGDKDGYVLYQHDIYADGNSTVLVDYVARKYAKGTYIVGADGTVIQVATGY